MSSTDQAQSVNPVESSDGDPTGEAGPGRTAVDRVREPIPQQRPPHDPTEQTSDPEAEPAPERTIA